MRKNFLLKFLSVLITVCIISGLCIPVSVSAADYSADKIYEIAMGIINWKKADNGASINENLINNKYLEQAGTTAGDWYQIGMSRLGIEDDYASYLAVIEDYVETKYETSAKLSRAKATEWHRISLAVLASGGNPESLGTDSNGNPIDLIADGTYNRGKTASLGRQGINGWIWGLIALDSMKYQIPKDAFNTRDDIINEILSRQLSDGGFALTGKTSDIDITAMAVQALAPYYNSRSDVKKVIDNCLSLLSSKQLNTGDYASWGMKNVESTDQVIIALCALGIDPLKDSRFIKNGNTLLDGVLTYRRSDGGFVHSYVYDPENPTSLPDESNSMAGEQTLLALAALWRIKNGKTFLYDFTDSTEEEAEHFNEEDKKTVDSLPDKLSTSYYVTVVSLLEKLENSPEFNGKEEYRQKLLAAKSEIEELQNKIDNINSNISNIVGSQNGSSKLESNASDTSAVNASNTSGSAENINSRPGSTPEAESNKATASNSNNAEEEAPASSNKIDNVKDKASSQKSTESEATADISNSIDLDDIISEYESLSEEDKLKVEGFEDIIKAKTQETTSRRAVIIAVLCLAVITALGTAIFFRIKKRRNRKLDEMEELSAMYGDEE